MKGFKAAGKREENDACIGYPEREQARPKVKSSIVQGFNIEKT